MGDARRDHSSLPFSPLLHFSTAVEEGRRRQWDRAEYYINKPHLCVETRYKLFIEARCISEEAYKHMEANSIGQVAIREEWRSINKAG